MIKFFFKSLPLRLTFILFKILSQFQFMITVVTKVSIPYTVQRGYFNLRKKMKRINITKDYIKLYRNIYRHSVVPNITELYVKNKYPYLT